jgi:2-oxo-4-hydroxy-4-carboxy-5-ureidoimidazoline decarboxylase
MRRLALRPPPVEVGKRHRHGDEWMAAAVWTMAEVNGWDRETFVGRLGFLFEDSPWIVAAVWPERPFACREELYRGLCAVVARAPADRQLALIRAHPDLVGRAALTGSLTRSSTGEQVAAGLDPGRLTAEEIARFGELNEAYKARFGFPFIICARENTKASILAGFAARFGNSRDDEIATALAEIEKICWYRLVDVIIDSR